MTQVNHSESDVMTTKKVDIFSIIADQQSAEFVDPGEASFTGESLVVNGGIKQAFTSSFGRFAVALILSNVGNDAVIEADFARLAGVEGAVGIENRSDHRQTPPFHGLEGRLEVDFQTKSIVSIAGHDARRGHHIPLTVGNGQNIAGFRPLAPLVSHALATFLGDSMAAIEVQLGQIEVRTDQLYTMLPNPLPTAIGAPCLPVMVDRLPTDLFFSG